VNGALTISEDRIVRPTKAETSTIDATIGYDFDRQIPTVITEYAIERSEVGEQYVTIKTETVLNLQADSMATKTKEGTQTTTAGPSTDYACSSASTCCRRTSGSRCGALVTPES
jgi:hypothetical protein